MIDRIISVAVALALCGCATSSSPPIMSAQEFRQIMIRDRAKEWKDPDSLRDASLSEPYSCRLGTATCACIEVNARNAFGGMTGLRKNIVVVSDGTVVRISLADFTDSCPDLTPFPELTGGGVLVRPSR